MTARERPQLFTRRVRDVGTAGRAKGQRRLSATIVPGPTDRERCPRPAWPVRQRVRDGRLRTVIGNVSTLDDAVAAFNPTERIKGKTIISVRPY
jgi:hypothetical protein